MKNIHDFAQSWINAESYNALNENMFLLIIGHIQNTLNKISLNLTYRYQFQTRIWG